MAGILYVDASATTGANNGSSWANAFQGQSGVRLALAAAVSGDQIWVANGTYLPTPTGVRSVSLDLKSGVALYGGFAGGETSLAQSNPWVHVAVLSGDLAGDDSGGNYADNSIHVVQGNSVGGGATLDGFRIRGGNADGSSSSGNGGGLLLQSSGVSVRRCVFANNRCLSMGGAVHTSSGYNYFEDCRFENNSAGSSGGAVQVFSVADEISRFTRCIFSGNSAPDGSAVQVAIAFDVFFDSCLVYGNTATGSFGAAIHGISETWLWIENCTIVQNSSTTAAAAGVRGWSGTTIRNSIVYFNSGPGGAQGAANQISGGGGALNTNYCCVQGGSGGPGGISADPQLAGGFRLTLSSPCVDSGNNTYAHALDLDRTPRRQDVPGTPDTGSGTAPIVDMGAYEAPGGLYEEFCPGDGSLSTPCPCGNSGLQAYGCANSTNGQGARLAVAGAANPDTVQLTAWGMRAGVLCIFLQGNVPITSGVVFGDGVRCVGGALKRIGSKNASASGIAFYPGGADPSISARSATLGDPIQAGTERWYQTWYRDNSPTFCPAPPGGVSNVTSGVIVHW